MSPENSLYKGNEAAPADLSPWIKPGFDLYAIAAQETTLSQKQQVFASLFLFLFFVFVFCFLFFVF